MPSKTVPVLGAACALTFAAYLISLATAVGFAAWQTDLSAQAREAETRVGALETQYYAAIAELSSTDAAAVGLVTPGEVSYVTLDGTPTFTRAGR